MIETAALIFAVYVGFEALPWWYASISGAGAGLYHVLVNSASGPRAEIIKAMPADERDAFELSLGAWTVGAATVLFTALYFVVRLISLLLKHVL